MKNIKEFKELIHRYETIQLPEIEAAFERRSKIDPEELKYSDYPYNYLTGCGDVSTCTLCIAVEHYCIAVEHYCINCVYGPGMLGCIRLNEDASDTYWAMVNSSTPEELLAAYRNRAKFMRKLLKEKGVYDGTGS